MAAGNLMVAVYTLVARCRRAAAVRTEFCLLIISFWVSFYRSQNQLYKVNIQATMQAGARVMHKRGRKKAGRSLVEL